MSCALRGDVKRTRKARTPGHLAPSAAPSSIDRRALARLRRQGGAGLVREIVTIFCEDMPDRLTLGRFGAETNNLDATRRAAHSLKSTAATVGARRLYALSERIEGLAARHESAAIAALLPDWEASFQAAQRDLTAVVSRSRA
jgi:two-component system, sensor histidine kinase and response regulator